ncbi:cobalamin biosynthesis protein CbiD [Cyanobacterium stanieri PCC 7202]|uniref:Cobalt-precorrin-5B C(1)-methyltransferase n=1 Tax=Cyanobacterium stanieri (strain ATCC 29140 / PCC 7202) TaxID=292563 RepID=K9YK13_CYASC|nr:cobalamin biosynthesis protein CbiD [Cyanobacterium stanieri PCC 7202]
MLNSGYTLPVFATASVVACLHYLQENINPNQVEVELITPPETALITIEQVALIGKSQALAITRSDPGENLDLTKNTPIWATVKLTPHSETKLIIEGGEGVGKIVKQNNKSAIYSYAQKLLECNILNNLKSSAIVEVKIILPEGKILAQRTSNEAFGVVDGLSLLGTTGISQPLTSKAQLDLYQQELVTKAREFDHLIFCIGENGLDLALKMGFESGQLVKTANWLGSMLVNASTVGVKSITILGYHGKLVKLAGGIFHTHHHLADGRLEILSAIASYLGLPQAIIKKIFEASTTESALEILRDFDSENNTHWVEQIYQFMGERIKRKSQEYIAKHSTFKTEIKVILFDRQRQIICQTD